MTLSDVLYNRWRSGQHVGSAKPTQMVQIQRGIMDKQFSPFTFLDGTTPPEFGEIVGGKHRGDPWHGFWRATGPWVTLPNVRQVDLSAKLGEDGHAEPSTATITIENVYDKPVNGVGGGFKLRRRGYLTPWRGFTMIGRVPDAGLLDARDPSGAYVNEWYDVLNGGCRIRVFEGYGDALDKTFVGLIDDTDVRVLPDEIVLSCRSFHELLTEERVFGDNKARDVPSPVVFADRKKYLASQKPDPATGTSGLNPNQTTKKVAKDADASTQVSDHPASEVLKEGDDTFWFSHAHSSPDVTEWVEIHVPAGRYEQIYVSPGYDKTELFISVYAKKDGSKSPTINGAATSEGWVNTGLGSVPGDNGGMAYVHHTASASKGGNIRNLGFTLECGDTSVIRVSVRNLGKHDTGDYRGKISRLVAYQITSTSSDSSNGSSTTTQLPVEVTIKVGSNAEASSEDSGHKASDVLVEGDDSFWFSQAHTAPGVTEWVEVRVPVGKYEQVYVDPQYDGMELFISIYAHDRVHDDGTPKKCTVNGQDIDAGWIDAGLGLVPGDNGGIPMVHHTPVASKGGNIRKLGFTLQAGDNTVFRISFRNLGKHAKYDYRAKVARVAPYKITATPPDSGASKPGTANWILVDDAADILKWVMMWAGFREWYIEPMGVSLNDPMIFHQADYLDDIVKRIVEQANYVFFVAPPTDHDDSIGVPHFERSRATSQPESQQDQVSSADLLTEIEEKFSKENLSYIIRVRGKVASAKNGGAALGEDATTRVHATYFPPWSGSHKPIEGPQSDVESGPAQPNYPFADRLAGVRKHVTNTDLLVDTENEALMKCLLIAIAEALSSFVGTATIPGYPGGFGLNRTLNVVDTPTGLNSRFYVTGFSSSSTSGPEAAYTTTLEGAMIDTPDILALAFDYLVLLDKIVHS